MTDNSWTFGQPVTVEIRRTKRDIAITLGLILLALGALAGAVWCVWILSRQTV